MFNDRDLSILGAGAVAAILCLMLPWTFAVKVAVAVVILVIAMALAFARMGADRLTLEQHLKRQLIFRFQPRKYSYFQKEKGCIMLKVKTVYTGAEKDCKPIDLVVSTDSLGTDSVTFKDVNENEILTIEIDELEEILNFFKGK